MPPQSSKQSAAFELASASPRIRLFAALQLLFGLKAPAVHDLFDVVDQWSLDSFLSDLELHLDRYCCSDVSEAIMSWPHTSHKMKYKFLFSAVSPSKPVVGIVVTASPLQCRVRAL